MSSRGTTIAIAVGLAAFLCVCMLALIVLGGLLFVAFSRTAIGPGPIATALPLFSATPAVTQSAA
ncbi:MAG: hypothetical protein HYZ49_20760 [Chloroflexi bacterium]|nr:hypothetical protein [Chloroflexota bacterium]